MIAAINDISQCWKKTRALLHVSYERLGFVKLAWNDKEDMLVNIVTALFLTLKGICEVKCTSLQFFSKFAFSSAFYEMTMAAVINLQNF